VFEKVIVVGGPLAPVLTITIPIKPGRCRLWDRLGRADRLAGTGIRGRCSPVSGPIPEPPDQAALGQQRKFGHGGKGLGPSV
jgi:hypothetical protein